MERRQFLVTVIRGTAIASLAAVGCRGTQHAKVMSATTPDLVGNTAAGAETWEPLIQTTVSQLLGREMTQIAEILPAGHLEDNHPKKRICFVGVENKSSEEIGDFRDQIYQKIDTCVGQSEMFDMVTRRAVEAGLRACQLRPDDLFVPANRRKFAAAMEQEDGPFDYLMYATITSGSTSGTKSSQRDYMLTLELIDMASGRSDKESAELRKAYSKSKLALHNK